MERRRGNGVSVFALQSDMNQSWDPGGQRYLVRSDKLFAILSDTTVAGANDSDSVSMQDEVSRTELDSHANMPVIGRHAYVLAETGKTVDVSPFTPDY